MTHAQTHRSMRNRLLVPVMLFVYLVFLAAWKISTVAAAPPEPLDAFTLGAILGALSGLCFVARRRWHLYRVSRP